MIIYDFIAYTTPSTKPANWRWGEGTRNMDGDFYYGDDYYARSIYPSPVELVREHRGNVRERNPMDPDLVMDEGL
jgi:hypothetical protein